MCRLFNWKQLKLKRETAAAIKIQRAWRAFAARRLKMRLQQRVTFYISGDPSNVHHNCTVLSRLIMFLRALLTHGLANTRVYVGVYHHKRLFWSVSYCFHCSNCVHSKLYCHLYECHLSECRCHTLFYRYWYRLAWRMVSSWQRWPGSCQEFLAVTMPTVNTFWSSPWRTLRSF